MKKQKSVKRTTQEVVQKDPYSAGRQVGAIFDEMKFISAWDRAHSQLFQSMLSGDISNSVGSAAMKASGLILQRLKLEAVLNAQAGHKTRSLLIGSK